MKHILISLLLFSIVNIHAQVNGPKSIIGQYKGDQKKKLAHGKGQSKGIDTYTGKFKNGYPNGKGEFKFGKDTVLFDVAYSEGDKYIGFFTNGAFDGSGKIVFKDKSKENKVGYWENGIYVGKTKEGYLIMTEANVEVECQFVAKGTNEIKIIGMSNMEVPTLQGVEFDGLSTLIDIPESLYPLTLSISGIVSSEGARGMFKIWIEKQGVWHIYISPLEL